TNQQAQVAGPGDEEAAEDGAMLQRGWKRDDPLVVDDGHSKFAESAAPGRQVAFDDELAKFSATVKIERFECFTTAADRCNEGHFVPVVEGRRIELDECAGRDAGRVGSAERDHL